ncbi:MAG: diacylglycerol kinase family protein, partial [Patescibacteria group bacterium]|nr:diacylglycerol kinase family protein [Patescibacteria group bacterium]
GMPVSPAKESVLTCQHQPLPSDADHVVVSVNPKAGARSSRASVDALLGLLREKGIVAEVDTSLDAVTEAAVRWHGEGRLRALVGVGGDGTAAELVNRTPPGLPFTMLPSGNENLLARYLGWAKSPEAVCRTLVEGRVVRLDAGRANGRLFLLMVGCGFDADVVRRVHARRTGHIRTRNYFKPICHSIRTYQYPAMEAVYEAALDAEVRDATVSDVARWLFVFNLPCYGGGLRIAPQAEGSDGLLDACLFRRGGLWHGLRYACGIGLRYHHRMGDVVMRRFPRMTVTANAEVPYQLDGDPGGVLPLEIESVPERLTLVVPREP